MPPIPLPPTPLMHRVGWFVYARSPGEVFEERGREQWHLIKSLLPPRWDLQGKRVLDFGCGAGRILRTAVIENPEAEFWGCDIDAPSVAWLTEHLSPPAHIIRSEAWPPVPEPDSHFDLVYAFSVFTHLLDSWSAWLLELHRLLAEDGVLIVTVVGPGHTAFKGEPLGEDIIGMNVMSPAAAWDKGGPLIWHSEWWLRAHWGRAFEIIELRHGDPAGPPPLFGQGVLVMRKRPGAFTIEDLEAPEPGEPRELAALKENVASLRREVAEHAMVMDSRSWRYTGPLRSAAQAARPWAARGRPWLARGRSWLARGRPWLARGRRLAASAMVRQQR